MISSAKRKSSINEDGLVWIENHKVFVKDYKGEGIPPTIIPGDDSVLTIDGNVYNHLTIVNSKNIIEIKSKQQMKESVVEVSVSKDELYAYIDFVPGGRQKSIIKDMEPQNSLTIETERKVEPLNNLTQEKIYEKLFKAGIVYGVDESVVKEILKSEKEQKFTVAKGIPPIEGQRAFVEYFFEDGFLKRKVLENKELTIDYKNINEPNYFIENQTIAIKHQSVKGKNGLSVKGGEIFPEVLRDIYMTAGKGIIIENDGTVAKTVIAGIPKRTLRGLNVILEISDALQIDHDIDLSTGNISYSNDIMINGNVNESMNIKSLGSVFVSKDVSFANITVLKDIAIKGNVISSKISSGISCMAGTLLTEILNDMVERLNFMIKLIDDLMNKPAFNVMDLEEKGVGVLIKLLLNLKLKDLPQKVFNLFLNARKENYGIFNDIAFESYDSLKVFLQDCTVIKTKEEVIKIREGLEENIKRCLFEIKESVITINYALNSEISSDGNVTVIGNGCYNTKIYSKGEVIVRGSFIGGQIFAEKLVQLSQVGSDIGVKSIIETTKQGRIRADKIHEGNIIKIGDRTYHFKETEYSINARLVNNIIVIR